MASTSGTLTPQQEDAVITLKRAREIAYEAHKTQKDKAGRPYVEHLEAVRLGVQVLGGDYQVQAMAILHDAVEDTDLKPVGTPGAGYEPGKRVTYAVLEAEGANKRQMAIIKAVTKPQGSVQADYLDGIVAAGVDAMTVKLADLLHNMRPDRLATQPQYTQNRLKKKYAPSIARIMRELGYLATDNDLATLPQGSYITSSSSSSSAPSSEWALRSTTWVAKGDEVKVSGEPVKVVGKTRNTIAEKEGNLTRMVDYWTFDLADGTSFTVKSSARFEARMTRSSSYSSPYSTGGGGGPKPSATSPCATVPFSAEEYEGYEGWGMGYV